MKILFKIVNSILFVIVMILTILLFSTREYSSDFLNRLNDILTNYLYLPKQQEQPVSGFIKFHKIQEYQYDNCNYTIYAPFSATIIKVSEGEIWMKCQNGYYGMIKEVINPTVKKYDVVHEDDILGYFTCSFQMYFMINDRICSYEEII